MTKYTSVRGLSRGLQVLQALNSMDSGRATSQQISDLTGLHRTTTRRLLRTKRGPVALCLPGRSAGHQGTDRRHSPCCHCLRRASHRSWFPYPSRTITYNIHVNTLLAIDR